MNDRAKNRWLLAAEIALVLAIIAILIATLLPAILSR